jgi:hypothetical protein
MMRIDAVVHLPVMPPSTPGAPHHSHTDSLSIERSTCDYVEQLTCDIG